LKETNEENMKKIKFFSFLTALFISACGGNAQNIQEGQKAIDFTLADKDGKTYKLYDYKGKNYVVIYFYPKASTPGCTKQACGIRDNINKLKENNIQVFGVSVDSKESLRDFVEKYNLNYTLLSDENKEVSKKYGVLNNLGFSNRITFIISPNMDVIKVIRNVDIENHVNDILNTVNDHKNK
jgi:peroxiredoxin Q/BCP